MFLNILITGANGFIGSRVAEAAEKSGWKTRSQVRNIAHSQSGISSVVIPSIDENTDWSQALVGINCIVHCAAHVQQINSNSGDALAAYRKVNTAGTLHLAKQAAAAGVTRFIFLSSIKVNGESNHNEQPFQSPVTLPPTDPYGLSKYQAEIGLQAIAKDSGLELVIIRPPLVYGEGVSANFLSMMNWIKKESHCHLARLTIDGAWYTVTISFH